MIIHLPKIYYFSLLSYAKTKLNLVFLKVSSKIEFVFEYLSLCIVVKSYVTGGTIVISTYW